MAWVSIAVGGGCLLAVSLLVLCAGRGRVRDVPTLEMWALGSRSMSALGSWFLLGSTIFTAYTFVAVPALVYGEGGLGFFAVPYTIVVLPIALVLLPRLWTLATRNGYTTTADIVRGRYGSPLLALIVALTGILAVMPYVALQLLGVRALLSSLGITAHGIPGDLILTVVFASLAIATFNSGLRAPALISIIKGVGVFAVGLLLIAVIPARVGGTGQLFHRAAESLDARSAAGAALLLPHGMQAAYSTLAIGSALALLLYPHVATCTFAARSADAVQRTCVGLFGWTALLAVVALAGLGAAAAGVRVHDGQAELSLPLLVRELFPSWVTGLVLGAIAVGALVPAAVMSIAVANLFARNVYVEFLHPEASQRHQLQVARSVSLLVKLGALAFVVFLHTQAAINLQLLGGVWILQTLPAVAIGAFTRWFHRWALIAGWAAGMGAGTLLVATQHFVSVVPLDIARLHLQVYAGLPALLVNLLVASVLTPPLRAAKVAEGLDTTGADQRWREGATCREWLAVQGR